MIPKIIHQIWLGDMPTHIKNDIICMKKFCKQNGYKHKLWTKDNLINTYISAEVFTLLCSSNIDIQLTYAKIADICRYRIIYECGGFYVDVDTIMLKTFNQVIKDHNFVCGYGDTYHLKNKSLIVNAVFGATKKHNILATINNIIGCHNPKMLVDKKPWKVTGPLLFTAIVEYFSEIDKKILILDNEYLCPLANGEKIDKNKLTDNTICWTYWNNNSYKKWNDKK